MELVAKRVGVGLLHVHEGLQVLLVKGDKVGGKVVNAGGGEVMVGGVVAGLRALVSGRQ